MSIFINPGSGPVSGATEENATINVATFAQEIVKRHKIAVTAVTRAPETDYGDGRFGFSLTMADGRNIEVQMPGLPLDQVRYADRETQNIWDYPRLYVDGSSWVWMFAVDVCEPDEAES